MYDGAKLLRVKEVAYMLGISERSVWRLVASGQLSRPLKVGGCTRFRRQTVEDYVAGLMKEQSR